MIPVPDIGHVYPKGDVDIRFDSTPRFVSTGSAYFDDTDDYVNCQDPTNSQMAFEDFSVVYWAKTVATAEHFCVSKQDGGIYDGYRFGFNGGVTRCSIQVDGSNKTGDVDGNTTVNDGVWHHFAFTVDRSANLLCYVDGQLDKTVDISSISGTIDPAEDLILGASYSGGSQNFGGNLCNVGIYKGTVLTEPQVRSIMGATTYAQTAAVVTPSLFYLLAADYTDSTGNQDATNVGSILVGDRARLPNGYDLSMTDGVPNQMNAQLFSGRAVTLDATTDWLTTTSSAHQFTGSWSVSFWAKSTTAAEMLAINRLQSGVSGWDVSLETNQDPAYWHGRVYTAAGGYSSSKATEGDAGIPSLLDDGVWRFITMRANDGTVEIYVDASIGATTASYSNSTAMGYSGSRTTIGGNNSATPANLFDGSLADVRLWNIALSAAQITELYKVPETVIPAGAAASNLISKWDLSDYDISGADSLGGLYFQDSGTAASHALANQCGMEFSQPSIPQLGLRSSSSRLYFDQDDDKVTVGNNAAINGLFASGGTESFWIFPNSVGEGTWGRILDATTGHMAFLGSASGSACMLFFYHDWSTDGNWNTTSTDITLGAWNHIVITYDGSSDSNAPVIYVNDSSKAVTEGQSPAGSIGNDDADKIIGNKADGSRTFDGYISEVAMWKTVLDADAVTAIYNSGVQGFDLLSDSGNYDNAADVDGWWKLDNPVTIQDLTANDNDGTVAGTPAMVTIPEGSTEGLSVMGSLTQNRLGSAVMPMSIVADEDAGSSPGILAYAKGPTTSFDNTDFTVTMWVYLSNTPSDMRYFHWVPGTGYILLKLSSAGKHQCLIEGGTTNASLEVNKDVRNAWSFVAFRKDAAADLKAYAGLVTEASLTTDTDTTNVGDFTGSAEWYLGSDNAAYRGLSGSIAMPRIWTDTALSDAQINALFNSGKRFLLGDS